MSDVPAVSVVIPLYNKAPYIARALKSVLTQTFQDFEVIVVEGCSTDGGAEVVRQFHNPRIRQIQQEDRGVSEARNLGIAAARADLVAFLDADDEWLPNFLETIMRLRKMFPDAGAYATAVCMEHKGTIKHHRYLSVPSTNWEGMITDYFRSQIFGDSVMRTSATVVPREILQEMNGFVAGAKWGEDLDLWGRIALNYPIGFSALCCAIYHVTAYGLEKIYSRVAITRENPFIKSADAAIVEGYNKSIDKEYLILYLDKIIIDSARYNAFLGRKTESKKILRKCRSKAFLLTKIFLNIWYVMPEYVDKKSNKIKDYSLFISYFLNYFELHILRFIMEFRKRSMD